MTEAAKKETKPKAPKAGAKAPAGKPVAKKEISGARVKVTQVAGTIARKWDQEATLVGLGLNKRHRSRVLKDTPEIRGMINKVRHLVEVEQA